MTCPVTTRSIAQPARRLDGRRGGLASGNTMSAVAGSALVPLRACRFAGSLPNLGERGLVHHPPEPHGGSGALPCRNKPEEEGLVS
jgi:hypothetical protein